MNGRKLGGAPLDLPKIRKNRLIEIIPINSGCLNSCTYCKTKHARGDLGSYLPRQVVERAQQAFGGGCVCNNVCTYVCESHPEQQEKCVVLGVVGLSDMHLLYT